MTEQPILDEDLHRYLDGELDPIRREAVRSYLVRHPEVARAVDAMKVQREELRAALAPIADEPVPADLSLTFLLEARHRRRARLRTAFAASALVSIGALGGWYGRNALEPVRGIAALAQEAATSYQVYANDLVRPVELEAADAVRLERWVSERLRRQIVAPDLSGSGYKFLGGRLVATAHGPAAMFLYEDGQQTRVGLLVRPMAIEQNAPMSEHRDGLLAGVAWAREGLGYSLVAASPAKSLQPLANSVQRQLVDRS